MVTAWLPIGWSMASLSVCGAPFGSASKQISRAHYATFARVSRMRASLRYNRRFDCSVLEHPRRAATGRGARINFAPHA